MKFIYNLFGLNKKYQAWRGNFYDAYFCNLENGEWIDVSAFRYFILKKRNYIVRIKNNKTNEH